MVYGVSPAWCTGSVRFVCGSWYRVSRDTSTVRVSPCRVTFAVNSFSCSRNIAARSLNFTSSGS